MRAKKLTVVSVLVILSLLLGTTTLVASPAQQATPPEVHLRAGDVQAGGQPIGGYVAGQRGYYIVQFRGPVEQAWKDQVTAQGAEISDYLPDFAFKVRMTPAQANRVQGLAAVAGVSVFQPAFKLSPNLRRDGVGLYLVRFERGVDFGLTRGPSPPRARRRSARMADCWWWRPMRPSWLRSPISPMWPGSRTTFCLRSTTSMGLAA